jgi:hypothetical protein
MLVYYDSEPEKIKYEALPDGTANVYLRQNIKQVDHTQIGTDGTETTAKVWTADEKNIQTTLTKEQVETQFNTLILDGDSTPTLTQRVAALEDAISALADMLTSTET